MASVASSVSLGAWNVFFVIVMPLTVEGLYYGTQLSRVTRHNTHRDCGQCCFFVQRRCNELFAGHRVLVKWSNPVSQNLVGPDGCKHYSLKSKSGISGFRCCRSEPCPAPTSTSSLLTHPPAQAATCSVLHEPPFEQAPCPLRYRRGLVGAH
jgi:hypothetical protein